MKNPYAFKFGVLFMTITVTIVGSLSSCKAPTPPVKPAKAKLLVGIVVDQMRYDYLTRFENQYGNHGFKRLMRGKNYTNHHFSYVPTATGPGHASVFTGETPKRHGIIGNNWPQKSNYKNMYCVEDLDVVCVGANDKHGARSPKNLLVPALGDWVKNEFGGKAIGISIKDRGAILPVGHAADAAYWFSATDSTANFVTSSYYMENLPNWVTHFNTKERVDTYLSQGWNTLLPMDSMTQSAPDLRTRENSLNPEVSPVFPYDLIAAQRLKGYGIVKYTPYGNSLLADFAKAAITNEQLGNDTITDLLTVSFSTPDYLGHSYGPNSKELHDMYLRLDTTIANFLTFLDQEVGKGEYLVFLTADHGAAPIPADAISPYYSSKAYLQQVNAQLFNQFGIDSLFFELDNYQLYVNQSQLSKVNLPDSMVYSAARDALLAQEGVDTAFTYTQMMAMHEQGETLWFLHNGWNPTLSGQVQFVPKKGWLPKYYLKHGGTGHGTHWSYDTHVPFLIYGLQEHTEKISEKHWVHQIVPDIKLLLN